MKREICSAKAFFDAAFKSALGLFVKLFSGIISNDI